MNNTIFYFLYNFAHRSDLMDHLIVFFAVYFPYLVVIMALLFLLMHHEVLKSANPFFEFKKKWGEFFIVFFAGGLAWVVARILKSLLHTPRPFALLTDVHSLFPETGYAFPSGHATFYFAIAVAIFMSHKKAGYVFMAFALLIGLARVMGGVHFPIDILGGFLIGALVAYFVKSV